MQVTQIPFQHFSLNALVSEWKRHPVYSEVSWGLLTADLFLRHIFKCKRTRSNLYEALISATPGNQHQLFETLMYQQLYVLAETQCPDISVLLPLLHIRG